MFITYRRLYWAESRATASVPRSHDRRFPDDVRHGCSVLWQCRRHQQETAVVTVFTGQVRGNFFVEVLF